MSILVQFLTGLLFGLGLIIAGMSDPSKVLNFLDFAAIARGGWDPSLAFVLGSGVIVTFVGYRLVQRRPQPVFDSRFHLPHKTSVDAPLLIGAAIFGVGWGLVGLCPGPSFVALGAGLGGAVVFAVAMLVGMVAARRAALFAINRRG